MNWSPGAWGRLSGIARVRPCHRLGHLDACVGVLGPKSSPNGFARPPDAYQTTHRHLRGEQSPAFASVPGPETIPPGQGDSAIVDGRLRAEQLHRQRSSAPGRGPTGMGCDQEVNDKPRTTAVRVPMIPAAVFVCSGEVKAWVT